jgi:hypothetical protein
MDDDKDQCRKLWSAVMEQAIEDLSGDNPRIQQAAVDWFSNRQNDGVGSFVWVCQAIDLDPDSVRECIRRG